ncbi:patatin-like phospholipase family protein [uncultured Roseibium sp.]|uniref:patatin-like phospholipase family protein n=1 Tax=uncultured Roseibium sp. TaxID=1936171 RepID=UPI00261DEC49|nr:patatin-like phospholipase family protein [uncultured Roseibium sp.]
MSSDSNNSVFTLGLTMAGAVSAGAYNAGVFDFLIQALEEWENAREADRSRPESERIVPNHRIVIPVISGASAGGATAALGLFGLSEATSLPTPEDAAKTKFLIPALYTTWVKSITFAEGGHRHTLLGNTDLKTGVDVASLLDGSVLRRTAEDVIRSATLNAEPRPYFAEDLHLFLTITNLRGVPYEVSFTGSGSSEAHLMTLHADRMHYRISGLGSASFESQWLKSYGDEGIPLSAKQIQAAFLDRDDSGQHIEANNFVTAAIATGAFPVGLPAQHMVSHTTDYDNRAWPYESRKGLGDIKPRWPQNEQSQVAYDVTYVGVDGGVINNEPFEIARWTIMETPGAQNVPTSKGTDRAVLLVDPFPQVSDFDPNQSPEETAAQVCLRAAILALFPALKNQARVKAVDLARSANDLHVSSRFLIAPSRNIGEGESERRADDPLATGVLSAFGGFLTEKFPEHDYQLGRRNCQQFLRKYFRVAEGNKTVIGWPANTDKRHTLVDDNEKAWRVLIPLFGSAIEEVPQPKWPQIGDDVILEFLRAIRVRGDALVKHIADTEFDKWYYATALKAFWWWKKKQLLGRIHGVVVADLIRRDQHQRFANLGSDLERGVLACFYDLAEDKCSPAVIAKTIGKRNLVKRDTTVPTADQVRSLLDSVLSAYVRPRERRRDVYVLRRDFELPKL